MKRSMVESPSSFVHVYLQYTHTHTDIDADTYKHNHRHTKTDTYTCKPLLTIEEELKNLFTHQPVDIYILEKKSLKGRTMLQLKELKIYSYVFYKEFFKFSSYI